MTNEAKYGQVPDELKKMFMKYLKAKGLEAKSNRFKAINHARLKMKSITRDSKNKEDCGVFVMRHIETYMGMEQEIEIVDLSRIIYKIQLGRLRVKYIGAILSAKLMN
nr:uncharacterized protein LOC109154218 [Ipomoea trifida]